MSSTASFIQRIAAGLSARARAGAVVVLPAIPAFVPAFGGGNQTGNGMNHTHMDTAWLGGFAATGCVKSTYATKRITTGSLREALT